MPAKTIKDIARAAGVSIATVSRAMNGSRAMREGTRKKVLDLARRWGYRPNAAARGLVGGRSHLIALVIPPGPDIFSAFYFQQIMGGVAEALRGGDYRLMVYQPDEYEPGSGYTPDLIGMPVDGLLVLCAMSRDRFVRRLETSDMPSVLMLARSPKLDWVDLDNVVAAAEAVRGLIRRGHRRVAHIAGVAGKGNTLDRIKGYRQAMREAGISCPSSWMEQGDYRMDSGYQAARRLLALGAGRPSAVFAANDAMALGAMRAFQEAGLRVPEDVSLVGFDDTDAAGLSRPALSTVRQPFREMGRGAAETLLSRLKDPGRPAAGREYLGKFVSRESCAAPVSEEVRA